jgi:hypothetical protein
MASWFLERRFAEAAIVNNLPIISSGRHGEALPEFLAGKMTNQMEPQASWAAAGDKTAALMEEEINRLKGHFEEKLARSHTKAHWEGMVEDCEIILNHLESGAIKPAEKSSMGPPPAP